MGDPVLTYVAPSDTPSQFCAVGSSKGAVYLQKLSDSLYMSEKFDKYEAFKIGHCCIAVLFIYGLLKSCNYPRFIDPYLLVVLNGNLDEKNLLNNVFVKFVLRRETRKNLMH